MCNLMNWEFVLRLRCKQNKANPANTVFTKRCWLRLAFFVLFYCLFPSSLISTGFANPDSNSSKLIEYLTQEKTNLIIANDKAAQLLLPANQNDMSTHTQQNKAMLALTRAKIANLESVLDNQRQQQQKLSYQLKKLQQSLMSKSEKQLAQEKINKINGLKGVNNKTIALLNDNLALAHRHLQTLLDEKYALELQQAKFDERRQLGQLHKRIGVLKQSRDNLYQRNIELQQQRKLEANFKSTLHVESKLVLNNQVINLLEHRITELELQKKLIKADYLLLKNHDVKTIQSVTETYKNAINQLSVIEQSLKEIVEMVKSEQLILTDTTLKKQFLNLQKTATSRLEEVTIQQQTLEEDLENKQAQLKKQLSVRQSFTDYRWHSWPVIFNQLVRMPAQSYNYLKTLAIKVRDNYLWQDPLPAVFFWLSLGLILLTSMGLGRVLRTVAQDKTRSRLTAHLYDGALILLHRNLPHLALMTMMVTTFYLNHVLLANYQLLLNLLLVWLAFRNLILIARLMLLERISDASGKDVRLYYRLKWLFLAGGWSTALMVFGHQLPLSSLLQDIFNRLFMLFLLAVSIVAWKSKDVIPYLMRPFLDTKKRYLRSAVSVLVVLVPLTLLTTSIIGLVGYFNLAWSLSRYQVYLLFIITGFVLARGLIFDALELLSEWMISSLKNGWLWVEVILKPLDNILRLMLLLLSTVIVFQLFGWYSDQRVMTGLAAIGKYPFVNISGVHITLVSTGEFILLLYLFIWAAKWTRELCYRWVYRNARDAGIRHSLSVFTQYAVILIGGFITLRVLGLDFSGMSMVLGGLAVGMGFGLRDFASNIIGGLMLLIERPVREGDLITLGEYEGRVAHIGIRSMRVSSWDNMEVLIPNAETFNKPFTNWTHQDSIVRTVIPIKVSRVDDPVMIQHLILDVLAIIPEILDEPPSQVFLKGIDDALIEFEVRYFINVQIHTRFEIRSKVLFAITAQFKAAGVKSPIPPLSIELKEHTSHSVVRSNTE